jgi:hypothetical protein
MRRHVYQVRLASFAWPVEDSYWRLQELSWIFSSSEMKSKVVWGLFCESILLPFGLISHPYGDVGGAICLICMAMYCNCCWYGTAGERRAKDGGQRVVGPSQQ